MGLIRNGLDYLVSEGYVDTSNRRTKRAYEALEDPEVDGLLDAANILSSQMKQHGQFPTWLESVFGSLSQEIRHPALLDVLKALHERGAALLTTNYDDVLEKFCRLERVGRTNQDDVSRFQRGDLNGVFHIHGSYHDAHEVVLDTTDYYEVKNSDGVQDMLKTFLQYKTILFVGCGSGLEDPNFDSLLRWASERQKNIPHRHYLLIRDDDSVKYQPLVRVRYGPGYEDLVVYLKGLLDDQTETNLPPRAGPRKALKDSQSETYPKSRTIASHRTVDSFSVRIDGWELPRSVGFDDSFVYFQVSTCYPCSVCESRISTLHAAIRENTRRQIENSAAEGGEHLQRNGSYTIIEEDQEAFFVFQYLGSKRPQDIAEYLSTRLGLHITVKRGHGYAIRLSNIAKK
jgi:hypothetical protein